MSAGRWVAVMMAAALMVGCGSKRSSVDGLAEGQLGDTEAPPSMGGVLGDDEGYEMVKAVRGEQLTEEEISSLLARLEPLEAKEGDEVEFRRRSDTLPPAVPGKEVSEAWPPDLTQVVSEAPEAGALEVLAFRPEGAVEGPIQLSVGFSRPMIAVGQVGEAEAPDITIEPQPEGRWRWLGTRTAVYEVSEAWPRATAYEVEVAAGATSVDGSTLEKAVRFGFETPPAEVSAVYPSYGVQAADAPVHVVFSQPVPDTMASKITVLAGRKTIAMRHVSGEEATKLQKTDSVKGAADEGRVLTLVPTENYPDDATVQVTVAAPIESKEGPLLGQEGREANFRVRGAFQVESIGCYVSEPCPPGRQLNVKLTNPIASDTEFEDLVKVTPEVPNLQISGGSDHLWLNGDFLPKTTYAFEVRAGLVDAFGQPLKGDRSGQVEIGAYPAFVAGPPSDMLVLPKNPAASLPVMLGGLRSLRARVFKVEAAHYPAFLHSRSEPAHFPAFLHSSSGPARIGELVDTQMFRFRGEEVDARHEVEVVLSKALNSAGTGQVMVVLDEPTPWPNHRRRHEGPSWSYWVQVTDLGLDLTSDQRTLEGRVTLLSSGQPTKGVQVVVDGQEVARVNDHGHFSVDVPTDAAVLEVRQGGGDVVMMPPNAQTGWWSEREWNRLERPERDQAVWYVIDDRGMYKPGETVTLKGWVRAREPGPRGTLTSLGGAQRVTYRVRESRGNEITSGTVDLDAFGGFEFDVELADNVNLGWAHVQLSVDGEAAGTTTAHSFQIQEFRRPEYEVSARAIGEPHRAGEESRFEVEAAYYAGGGLAGAPVTWRFAESAAGYTPPDNEGWTFGAWRPYWGHWGWQPPSEPQVVPEALRGGHQSVTDARGISALDLSWEAPDDGLPRRVQATMSVMDVNRQSWEASASALVHPAAAYVGLKSEQTFVQRGEAWEVLTRVVDVDGAEVEGASVEVVLYLARTPWSFTVEDAEEFARCTPDGEGRCVFKDLSADSYRAVATVEDEAGRSSVSHLGVWAAGQDTRGADLVEEKQLVLIPDQETYSPGEVAKVMVNGPFYPMDATVELRRQGRYETRQVRLSAENPVVEIPIEDAMTPALTLTVQSLGVDDAASPDAFARGELQLKVEPVERRLNVAIEPAEDQVDPGSELGVDVVITDHQGKAVSGANVALFAVDEAVLGLSNYALRDPLSIFYPELPAGVYDMRTRRWLIVPPSADEALEREEAMDALASDEAEGFGGIGAAEMAPKRMMRSAAAPMASGMRGGGGAPAQANTPIAVREVFDALAFFEGDLVTDAEGRVRVEHTLPDSLTRYRLMAVVVEGDRRFGHGESQVVARLPLMVRPSAPRFANVGDRFELPIVLHNQTDEARSVDLALRAVGGLKWLESPGRRVEVPANQRVEVRWKAEATSAGEVRVQMAAASGSFADAELITMPVLTPATTEAFATYGSLSDEDVIQELVQVPEEAFSQYGGLEFSASSTQLQALTDAFIYLTTYPYACSEQTASRLMSVLALYDVLDAFEAEGLPSVDALKASQQEWVDQIVQAQRGDGGFGFWKGSRQSWPFVSVHATHALWMADEAGLEVPAYALQRARAYIAQVERYTTDYSPRSRATVDAYALHVLEKMGVAGDRALDDVVTRYGIEVLPLEALGWLLPIAEGTQWEARFMQRLQNNVQETAATAEFQEAYEAGAYRVLHSGRRTDAVVLDGLMQTDAQNPLTEKVMRGLMAHRKRGRWSTTQDNVFVILAMRRYFDTFGSVSPNFVARAWIGDAHFAEHDFSGRTGERYSSEVPMSYLQELDDATQPVVIERDGQGRMYYRLGMRYAPKNLDLPATSEGMEVERIYEAVDNESDVRRAEDGVWEIKAGARVRVTLTMTLPARRYHVALADWLPAGFEPINTELAVSDVEPGLNGGSTTWPGSWWWGWRWYEHQNTRDERVEAFASMVGPGVHTFNYVARATTPGEFVAPPAKAEEMYHPETFGRSATERVRVVAPAAE
ncbi:hypothetical protein FRC98_05815 [Lujinxingia vulgaris]|uniref:Alpha-2-macroglobulin n=1 Tax=Lujinxingia vulgaris TaxID=2600176 RepID=A0A5C6XG65_9DELT|nr:alpha-2-macroglobulin family protein [Lujinxingia vulgaris]TXD38403.1 hypothetical protein FRC98_05815 [Lujinxingia vulgaris]